MSGPRPNASNPRHQRFLERRQKRDRDRELSDLRHVLSTDQGRRVLWRLLEHCSVFRTIWDPSSRIHHNAGRQDVGHFVMAELEEADEEAIYRMMREAKLRQRSEDAEFAASLTPSAEEREP